MIKNAAKVIVSLIALMALAGMIFLSLKSIPQPLAGKSPSTPIIDTSYPPPQSTESARSAAPTGYPPPPILAPTLMTTTLSTLPPLTPHPPDWWPTDQPWPPGTKTPMPPEATLEIVPFPSPDFRFADNALPDLDLESLWVPSSPGYNASLSLDEILLNSKGERKDKAKIKIDMKVKVIPSIPQMNGLILSPDGSTAEYVVSSGEGGNIVLLNLSTGETFTNINSKRIITGFYNWDEDGQHFLANFLDTSPLVVSLVETKTGESENIEFKERAGIEPEVQDLAFSPDGNRIVDAVSYQPIFGKHNPWVTEIGVRAEKELSIRDVICVIENGRSVFPHSLKWSPDGMKLMWIGGLDAPDVKGWDLWLWIADLSSKSCQKMEHLGDGNEGPYVPGGYSADWSPDSRTVAFRPFDLNAGYSITLLDLETGKKRDLHGPTQEILSNVHFSPDGKLVTYSLSKMEYGEIWAISLDGRDNFPIAGPTPPHAPYKWLSKIK